MQKSLLILKKRKVLTRSDRVSVDTASLSGLVSASPGALVMPGIVCPILLDCHTPKRTQEREGSSTPKQGGIFVFSLFFLFSGLLPRSLRARASGSIVTA